MKAVVLHSGGLDSTTCLLMAKEQGREVVSLGIDYGQRAAVELEYAARQCARFGVARRVLRIGWHKPDRVIPTNRSLEEIAQGVSSAFLPGRNAVFLVLAVAEACGIGAAEIWFGANCVDYSGYPDCRPEFIQAFRNMMRFAVPDGPEIVTPLLTMAKPEIANEAFRLGIRRGDTWSCYRPQTTKEAVEPCGKCDGCVLHEYAWSRAGTRHPSTGGASGP